MSLDYFVKEGNVVKTYTEREFIIGAVIANPTNSDLVITAVNVKTVSFESITSRILRQSKFNGIVEPLQFEFIPKDYPEGECAILERNQLIEVKSGKSEYLKFILSDNAKPGFYQLIFDLVGRFRQKTFSVYSSVFALNKLDPQADILNLHVVGKYYDTPVKEILNLDESSWAQLKLNPELKFLGQTFVGSMSGEQHETWKVIEMGQEGDRLLLDLKIPIQEELQSSQSFLNQILKGFQ